MTETATEPARISSIRFSVTAVVDDVFQAHSRKRDQHFRTGDSLDDRELTPSGVELITRLLAVTGVTDISVRDQVSTPLGTGHSFEFDLGPAAIGPASPSVLELVQPILQAAKTPDPG